MRGYIRRRTGKRGVGWQVIVHTPPDPMTGRARQISATAHSKREAEAVLNRLLAEVGAGRHSGPDVTMAELLEQWFAVASPDWSPKTVVETRRFIDNYVVPHLGRVKVRKLTTAQLDGFYGMLKKRGGREGRPLSVASVRRVHVVVRRSLSQAKRWGWVSENVAADASPGRVPRREITPPDPEVTMRLIEQAEIEDPDFGVFLRLAATTGARRGELCALRWRDVDLAEGTLTISRALVDCADGGYVEKDTKTHAARRIALDASMVKSLRAHKQRQAERALMGGVRIDGQTRVFSYEPDGSVPWRPDGVTARFVRLRDGLGFTGVRLHDLRHFVATRMLAAGVPVPTVSGRLGHANSSTTLNVYSHFLEASDREAAEALGRLLDSTRSARSI